MMVIVVEIIQFVWNVGKMKSSQPLLQQQPQQQQLQQPQLHFRLAQQLLPNVWTVFSKYPDVPRVKRSTTHFLDWVGKIQMVTLSQLKIWSSMSMPNLYQYFFVAMEWNLVKGQTPQMHKEEHLLILIVIITLMGSQKTTSSTARSLSKREMECVFFTIFTLNRPSNNWTLVISDVTLNLNWIHKRWILC